MCSSDLCVFFHAPLGQVDDKTSLGALDQLLNVWGYYVEITDNEKLPAFLSTRVPQRKRFRLMEFMQPSEKLSIYQYQDTAKYATNWFSNALSTANPPVRVLAENIVALVILPRLSKADELLWMKSQKPVSSKAPILAPAYTYDTTNKRVADQIGRAHV